MDRMLTPAQYAKIYHMFPKDKGRGRKTTVGAKSTIIARLSKKQKLPGVMEVKEVSNRYLLCVDEGTYKMFESLTNK